MSKEITDEQVLANCIREATHNVEANNNPRNRMILDALIEKQIASETKQKVVAETHELYAFWEYDTYPYFIGGEIESFYGDGNVSVKEQNGYVMKPVLILPKKEGIELKDRLEELEISRRFNIQQVNDMALKNLKKIMPTRAILANRYTKGDNK